jgi:O-antigen ligase
MDSQDISYWISLAGQALWFPAVWAIVNRKKTAFDNVIKSAIVLSTLFIVLFWLLGVLQTSDPFFLRNSLDHFEFLTIAPDIFSNPNRAARTLIMLLMFSMFLFNTSGRKESKGWSVLNLTLTILIFFTLSRSGIASAILLWTLHTLGQQKIKRKTGAALSAIALGLCIALLLPRLGDRIEQAIVTIVDVRSAIQSNTIDARSMTIRARSWGASTQIISDNPIFGIGVSRAIDTMGSYGSVGYKGQDELKTIWVHGGFLKIAVYSGLLGLTAFALLLFTMFSAFVKNYRKTKKHMTQSKATAAAWMGIAGLVASFPVNIGADFFGVGTVWFVFAYLLAHSSLIYKKVEKKPKVNKYNASSVSYA